MSSAVEMFCRWYQSAFSILTSQKRIHKALGTVSLKHIFSFKTLERVSEEINDILKTLDTVQPKQTWILKTLETVEPKVMKSRFESLKPWALSIQNNQFPLKPWRGSVDSSMRSLKPWRLSGQRNKTPNKPLQGFSNPKTFALKPLRIAAKA